MEDWLSNGFPFEWIDTNRISRPPGDEDKPAYLQPFDTGLDSPEVLNLFGSEIKLELPDLVPHGDGSGSQALGETTNDTNPADLSPQEQTSHSSTNVNDEVDIWRFDAKLVAKDQRPPFRSWGTFEKKSPPNPRPTKLLSEAGPRIFDAAVPKTTYSNIPSGAIPQTAVHTALFNLALGRSSIFFQWDGAKQQFLRTLEDAPISGLSPQCTETYITNIAEYGTAYRLLNETSVTGDMKKQSCPAIVAFQCCVAELLDGLGILLTEHLPRTRSFLDLQQLLEMPRRLLHTLRQLSDALGPEKCKTDEEAISVLAGKVHGLAGAGSPFCEAMRLILSRTSATWLKRVSNDLGLADEGQVRSNYPQNGTDWISHDSESDSDRVPSFVDMEDYQMIQETRSTMKLLREHVLGYQGVDATAGQIPVYLSPDPTQGIFEDSPPGSDDPPDLLVWADSSAQEAYIANLDARINQHPNPSTDSSKSFWRDTIAKLLHPTLEHPTATFDTSPGLLLESKELRFHPLDAIRPALQQQHQATNRALLTHFFKELRLRDQLHLQQQFHLFGNGAFVSRLSTALFSEETQSAERKRGTVPTGETMGLRLGTRQGKRWPPASSELRLTLLGILNETYKSSTTATSDNAAPDTSKELPGGLSFSIRELPDDEIEKVMDAGSIFALDFLRLSYQPSAPLDAIFTASAMQAYDDIFRFLLKLLRLVHVTTKLRERVLLVHRNGALAKSEIVPTVNDDAMTKFSSECHIFISTLFSYIMDIGIQAPWKDFMNAVNAIDRSVHETTNSPSTSPTTKYKISKVRTRASTMVHAATLDTLKSLHDACLDKIKTRLFLLSRRDAKLRAALEEAFAAVLRCNGIFQSIMTSNSDGKASKNGNEAKSEPENPVREQNFLAEFVTFRAATQEFVKSIAWRVEQGRRPKNSATAVESWEGDAEALGVLLGSLGQFVAAGD